MKNRLGQRGGSKIWLENEGSHCKSRAGSLCRDLGPLVKRKKKKKSTLRLYDNRASPVSWDLSIVMQGSRVENFQVITLAGQMN